MRFEMYLMYLSWMDKQMMVWNYGDGGWRNWGFYGRLWVRWGNTVKFHKHWNEHMGKPFETPLDPRRRCSCYIL